MRPPRPIPIFITRLCRRGSLELYADSQAHAWLSRMSSLALDSKWDASFLFKSAIVGPYSSSWVRLGPYAAEAAARDVHIRRDRKRDISPLPKSAIVAPYSSLAFSVGPYAAEAAARVVHIPRGSRRDASLYPQFGDVAPLFEPGIEPKASVARIPSRIVIASVASTPRLQELCRFSTVSVQSAYSQRYSQR